MALNFVARVLALLLCFIGGNVIVWHIVKEFLVRRRLRKYYQEHPQSTIPVVGSPEYNHLVVKAVYDVNQRLAAEGKRIPERVAMEIIYQDSSKEGQQPESEA